jgi:hypothetical protein
MLIERLRRKVLGINYSRTSDLPNTYPDAAFFGTDGGDFERKFFVGRRYFPVYVP